MSDVILTENTRATRPHTDPSETSSYHAKYYAWEITRKRRGGDVDRISQSLFDASVDLNPHQIDAALFALDNPLSKGVMLADEVGLGKTIEAALVLCQLWAERRRKLLVICPASLRKQWASELSEKFHLPVQVLDAKTWRDLQKGGVYDPLQEPHVHILSYNFAARISEKLRLVMWDLVVIDEAHKLRNAHRDSHRTGQSLKTALAGCKKVLLTATPLQNSLLELYGLSTVIDEQLFGDATSFRAQFMRGDDNLPALKKRLEDFIKRTLRKDVLEYVKYTERKAITAPFRPSDDEQRLYDLVSAYLQREETYGFPRRHRHLIGIVVRKLLASSTQAVVSTLESVLARLKNLERGQETREDWLELFLADEDISDEYLEEESEGDDGDLGKPPVDITRLRGEIAELEQYIELARRIQADAKSFALLKALETGFQKMSKMGAQQKAVVFTESRRTQEYLSRFLESHGYAGKVVTFSGTNTSAATKGIYERWLLRHKGTDRITGSAAVDKRTALIDHFREEAQILIATEAGAEGINLQFCSLVVNYDLPWNPQRVEQRIGRCHRYGQAFDVVVINFLNQRNEADRRVLELLSEKFHLFDGIFGASDEVLGQIESGIDVEKRIARIFDECRTPAEIEQAFDELRKELEDQIQDRIRETQQKLLENFDTQIHDLLRLQRERAEERLDRIARLFWRLTQFALSPFAKFDSEKLLFQLALPPINGIPAGKYQLLRKGEVAEAGAHAYRLGHPLGEYVLDSGKRLETPTATVEFDLTHSGKRISALSQLKSSSGWLELNLLELHSFEFEEHLVFSAVTDDGERLDAEACDALFSLPGRTTDGAPPPLPDDFPNLIERQVEATLSRALEENNQYFEREREKLDAWADDQILASEKKLEDTRDRIRDTKRKARLAETVDEQIRMQEEVKSLERVQRRQRQEIFDVQDEIDARRDRLIDALERRLKQKTDIHRLFRIRWAIV